MQPLWSYRRPSPAARLQMLWEEVGARGSFSMVLVAGPAQLIPESQSSEASSTRPWAALCSLPLLVTAAAFLFVVSCPTTRSQNIAWLKQLCSAVPYYHVDVV